MSFSNDLGSIVSSYKLEGNKVVYSREIKVRVLAVEPDQFSDWNKLIKELKSVYNTTLEFK